MGDTQKKYKYLVTVGCSQTSGQNCEQDETWPVKLSNKLGLKLINLASPGSGWYHVQSVTTDFIQNNKNILNECFFIFQKSMLERTLNYEQIPIVRTDIWEDFNIKYLSKNAVSARGYKDWKKYSNHPKPDYWDKSFPQYTGTYTDCNNVESNLGYFPEHRHYPNSRNPWKLGQNTDIYPPYIHEQFQELMLYWGYQMYSFHLFIKSLNIDHIMVDGYSPFLSHKLKFTNYYDSNDEFEFVKRFWSNESMERDEDEIMLYDFKNINSEWIYDSIESKYKIDDVVIWSLYQYPYGDEWSPDGGHAGPAGMNRIVKVIYQNLINKNWFNEIHS